MIRIPIIQDGMTIYHILATFDHGTYYFVKVSKAKRQFKQQQRMVVSETDFGNWKSDWDR